MDTIYRSLLGVISAIILLLPSCGGDAYDQPPEDISTPAESEPAQNQSSDPPPAKLPIWEPDPELLEGLKPYQDVGNYQIRLPEGFESLPTPTSKPGVHNYAWGGSVASDGTRPLITITIGIIAQADTQTATDMKTMSLHQVLQKMQKDFLHDDVHVIFSEPELGQLHGGAVLKVRGDVPKQQWPVEANAVYYIYRDNDSFVTMQFIDSQSSFAQSSKLGETAILTFRKKQ